MESSNQAFMRSLGTIWFNVDQGSNVASSILASKNIYYKPLKGGWYQGDQPASFTSSSHILHCYGWHHKGSWFKGCACGGTWLATLKGGEAVNIETGFLDLTGSTNGGLHLTIDATRLVARNLTQTSSFTMPDTTIMIDVGAIAQKLMSGSPLFRQNSTSGKPFMGMNIPVPEKSLVDPKDMVFLQARSPSFQEIPLPFYNQPLQSTPTSFTAHAGSFHMPFLLSPAVLQFSLMQALSDIFGTLNIDGHSGDDLIRYLHKNAKDTRKQVVSPEDLRRAKRSMIIYQTRKVMEQFYNVPVVIAVPKDINPHQPQGL